MKKIIFIICSFLLVFPFVFLGVFAYDPVDSPFRDDLVRSVSPSFSYSSLSFAFPPYSHPSSYLSVSSSGTYRFGGSVLSFDSLTVSPTAGDAILYAVGDETHSLITSNGQLNASWDGYIFFDSPVTLSDSFVNWYNSFSGVDSSVYSGVKATVGFSGQVLSFITSSSGVLSLLGLSVALFLLVPFSIRKIKQFVKGY